LRLTSSIAEEASAAFGFVKRGREITPDPFFFSGVLDGRHFAIQTCWSKRFAIIGLIENCAIVRAAIDIVPMTVHIAVIAIVIAR
jgi:hypothetical protein